MRQDRIQGYPATKTAQASKLYVQHHKLLATLGIRRFGFP
jgi:hypothetical protein